MPARSHVTVRLGALAAALLLVAALVPGVVSGTGASGPLPGDANASDQVIVRWVDGSAGTAFGAVPDAPSVGARPDRVAAVSTAAGRPATWLRTLAVGGDVYRFDATLAPEVMASTVVALRARPGVAGAEPDGIAHAVASPPNDPCWYYGYYPCSSPGQWDLSEGTTPTTYGIDLLGAWDRTRGAGVVVAVIDTGITTHPDLAGQTVAGYDFISSTAVSNDGNGRDADPSDPGDWITSSDPCYPYYGPQRSSWHGTHVTGTIAAATNNATGIAGIAYQAKVQPVRVLGKCGGYDSDISDAMVWASGGAVTGVPANATPARVENLSLAGQGPCPSYMQSAVNVAVSRGTVVAVAAGNDNLNASIFAPANCSGVITVAATTRQGTRASFSNYGAAVEIAAPGVSLWSTWNTGATAPGTPWYTPYSGTSMATPHVAAVAALMIAAKPSLTPAQVLSLMQQTAHPFAANGCPQGCGAGIVDAARAVAAAVNGVPTPTPTPTPTGGPTPTPTGAPTPTPTATPSGGCTRGTPVVTAVPTSLSVTRGSSGTVSLAVRNTDSAACGTSTFAWSATRVSGSTMFAAGFSGPTSVTVAPGATGGTTALVTVYSRATVGSTATFSFAASRSAAPTTAAVTVLVTAR